MATRSKTMALTVRSAYLIAPDHPYVGRLALPPADIKSGRYYGLQLLHNDPDGSWALRETGNERGEDFVESYPYMRQTRAEAYRMFDAMLITGQQLRPGWAKIVMPPRAIILDPV